MNTSLSRVFLVILVVLAEVYHATKVDITVKRMITIERIIACGFIHCHLKFAQAQMNIPKLIATNNAPGVVPIILLVIR